MICRTDLPLMADGRLLTLENTRKFTDAPV
jgi:hypothetical protein